jgi:glyoxylase-like metal-dependent hydrolase (beta-lactamase superfamily II)
MRTYLAFIAALSFAAPGLAQTPPPPPLVKTENIRQVSAHVHIIPDDSVSLVPNVGFIVGDRGVLVVDTGLGERNGKAVAAAAQKLGGQRAIYLVATHFHPEHDLGAQGFPAATKMIRSTDQEKDIAEFGLQMAQTFSTRSPFIAELLQGAAFRKADITFTDAYMLDLGGVRVQLMAGGPNHTRGDTIIWIEADRLLFSGDIAMKPQPAFASPYSNLAHWLASLDKLAALKAAVIVPSHGPTGDESIIAGYRTYLTEIRDRTAAEKRAGKTADQVVEIVTTAMADRFADRGRLGGAIRAAYAEAK